jgi:hypothetical protein
MNKGLLQEASSEMVLARKFAEEGFLGKSRVCARRASAAAIRMLYLEKDLMLPTNNAYELLRQFPVNMELPADIILACQTLTMRVDESFHLPANQDPILAASRIIEWISNLTPESE